MMGLDLLEGFLLICGLLLPVLLWGICCGFSCTISVWDICSWMSPLCLLSDTCWLTSWCNVGEDVLHLQFCDLSWIVVHDDQPLAMLYFHRQVKKGAARPPVLGRIQNFLWLFPRRGDPYSVLWTIAPVPSGRSLTLTWYDPCTLFRTGRIFDGTLGYPGEGPKWTVVSANIDSFSTNASCLQWEADAFFLQEARVSESNLVDAQRKAALCNMHLFCSQPLQRLRASNGTLRTPSGGTATCSHREVTQVFGENTDHSGCWATLRSSARVTATWHQVSTSVKMLAFNFYAIANAASERAKFERNNEMLNQIFTIAAQFGDIPILVAGDFQMEPGMYPCVQLALDHWGWSDPLLQTDQHGEAYRPNTFFQHAATEDGEGQSSIDGILLNRTALTALLKMEVLDHTDRQHRPIQATFMWDRVEQVGSVLQKLAPLDLQEVRVSDASDPGCPINDLGQQLWQNCASEFEHTDDANVEWKIFNDFAIRLLLQCGASWGKGPQTRGQPPTFHKVRRCALQEETGNPATPRLRLLQACLRTLRELSHRFKRDVSGPGDARTFRNTQRKLLGRMKEAKLIPSSVQQLFAHDLDHLMDMSLRAIAGEVQNIKFAAIQKWRDAMKQATTSLAIGKIVYQYLKRKGRVIAPNLIEDEVGNILYDPHAAMDLIASQWDTVYAVNSSHDHELDILRQIWPYLHDKRREIRLPAITAHQLWEQAAKRRPDAAAGLDGWRTREVQALPPCAFQPVAALFNDIEAGRSEFPGILTQVRMVIHNKDGSDAPLSKRLISLQSVFTLLYTGLRFAQLQQWQQDIMPIQLKGGIKGRQMTEVHMTIQLEIDHAHSFGGSFAAVKLDKSKCFDRLMPKLCAALMLALGLPSCLVRGFLALYTRMTRFLSLKQWTREKAISTPNGVVQGCSLSLLCINLHMAVWIWIVENIPGIDFRAFIDDTYLWSRLPSIDGLVAAVKATELWDSLCGQFLNSSKCEMFATSGPLRRALKHAFPQMRLVEVVNILGAYVQSTKKNAGMFPPGKLQSALRDCEAIRSLPCDSCSRAQILTTKVLPQIAFAPQLNFLPKRQFARLQSAIADALWQNRPRWRSKHLLLCVIHKAHKLDPFLFRAVATIVESVRYLQSSASARRRWEDIYEQDQLPPQSWMTQFGQACQILDMVWSGAFSFTLMDAPAVSFLDFSVTDLKCILKSLAANRCYHTACQMPRKDIQKAAGFLDLSLTLSAKKKLARIPNEGFSFLCYWESALTGCTLTGDRLAAAGLIDNAKCRFCGSEKEDIRHLVEECTGLPAELAQPSASPFFGPNFPTLGVVEMSHDSIKDRLQVSNTAELPVSPWVLPLQPTQHVWTDGSVQLSHYPWLTVASYAVVGCDGSLLDSGRVRHWRLSSYSAELWAVLAAFAMAHGPLVIHSDSLTIVNQFNELLGTNQVQHAWTHSNWWGFLLHLIHQREALFAPPLQMIWCPAHLLEHVASHDITDDDALQVGSTRQDIVLNRCADQFAKHFIHGLAKGIKADLAVHAPALASQS